MFDVDSAVAEWRRQLMADGIKSPEVLNELESHLREEVDQRMRSGLSEQKAFTAAVEQLGQADVLKREFAKAGGWHEAQERVKGALFTLAGVPNPNFVTTMNTSHANLEPGWATYLKGATFIAPAVLLWMFSAVFLVPKLQQISLDAGLPGPNTVWDLTHSNFLTIRFFGEYGLFIVIALIGMLFLLEWRSVRWPRYRRATVGVGAFLLNLVVLLSISMMVVTACVAAPAFGKAAAVTHAK